jgi:hypothetical protein
MKSHYKYQKKYKKKMQKLGKYNRGNRTAQGKRYRKKYHEKVTAHRLLYNAIQLKIIKKPKKCSICLKNKKLVGHHIDYNKPLEIIWVCYDCHNKIHNKTIPKTGGDME